MMFWQFDFIKFEKYPSAKQIFRRLGFAFWLIFAVSAAFSQNAASSDASADDSAAQNLSSISAGKNTAFSKDWRIEKIPVKDVGAEVITVFAGVKVREKKSNNFQIKELPLFSILRDTLGDEKTENDRLRYAWLLTYVRPSPAQKISAAVPFLYTRTVNKKSVGSKPPPVLTDLSPNGGKMWNSIFWSAFKYFVVNDLSAPLRLSFMQSRNDEAQYRQAAVERALNVLSLYESLEGEKILSEREIKDIRAKMWLSDSATGSLMQSENLHKVYQKNVARINDVRGHNWELLRQYSEAQKLYFEPLQMPDGSQTHAVVWVAEQDLRENANRKFNSRFLNIRNPWQDTRLNNWNGYREVRWYDENNSEVAPDTPGARPKTLIPLALYGLDYPKIPILLVDFRDRYNPKKREMSRRILEDIVNSTLQISKFGNLPFFFGRFFYDWVTARRGMDLNQVSRFRSYSQLKLLLALSDSLDTDFRSEIGNRLESVSLNPLENDLDAEISLAVKQYANLIEYAKNPNGLAKRINNDRREEMVKLKHGAKERIFFDLMNFLSLGIYKHREKNTPELFARMDLRRQADYHERFLRETAQVSVKPEIDSDIESVRNALLFINSHPEMYPISGKTLKAVAKIFSATDKTDLQELSLNILKNTKTPASEKLLTELYKSEKLDAAHKKLVAVFLNLPQPGEEKVLMTGGADSRP